MVKYLLTHFFLLVLLSNSIFSQPNNKQIDSLKRLLSVERMDTTKVNLLIKIGEKYENFHVDTSLQLYTKAFNISEKIKSENLIALCYKKLGDAHFYLSNYDKSLENYDRSSKIYSKIDNKYMIASNYIDIGNVFNEKGDLNLSLENYIKAKDLMTSLGKLSERATCLSNIAMIYYAQGEYSTATENYILALDFFEKNRNYDKICMVKVNLGNIFYSTKKLTKALEYYKSAAEIAQKINNNFGYSFCLNNIGTVYTDMEKYDEALQYHKKALEIRVKLGNKSEIAFSNANIGATLLAKKDYQAAKKYIEKAIQINIEIKNKYSLCEDYYSLGEVLTKMNQYEQAQKWLKKSVALSDSIQYKNQLSKSLKMLSVAYEESGNYKEAYQYFKQFYSTDTSIFNATNLKNQQEIETKYESQKKKLELEKNKILIDNQNTKINNKQRQLFMAIVALFVTLILAFFVLWLNVKRKKINKILKQKNKELEKLNQLRDDLTGMIVHDLKNPLSSIINFARMMKEEKAQNIENSALKMIQLVNNIIDTQKLEDAKMILKPEEISINSVINNSIETLNSFIQQKNIKIENNFTRKLIGIFDKELIERVVSNLLSNAIKFTDNNGVISIDYEINNNSIKVKITDYGKGIPTNKIQLLFNKYSRAEIKNMGFSSSSGLGLAFCKLVIDAHNETIGVISEEGKGSCFWFTVKFYSTNEISENISRQTIISIENKPEFEQMILPLKKVLASYNFYQTSEILEEISNFQCTHSNFANWKMQLENAVLYSNKDRYEELIKIYN